MASENESLKVGDEVACCDAMIGGWQGIITKINVDTAIVAWNDKAIMQLAVPLRTLQRIRIPPAQAEPVKEWVPEHMEEVWVKAKVTSVVDGMAELDFEGADDYIVVPLSQLRPLPVTQEEGDQ